jgi:putative RNA 2'-phosphotransferase
MARRVDTALSRTVSHALRHAPRQYELEPDAEGWVPVDMLLRSLRRRRRWGNLTRRDLEAMVTENDKQRFELSDGKIRALYGHSLDGRLAREPATPPAFLFHGTDPAVLHSIRTEGLLPMSRQYVHLSTDVPTAQQVGRRKAASPVILQIDAGRAYQDGVQFYRGNHLVWLADRVPPQYIDLA